MARRPSQSDLLMEFFKNHPNRDIKHPEVVDWATAEWKARTGEVFRDPDRGIRKLHQNGYLIKVKKGVYRYDPDMVGQKGSQDFSPAQKAQILERDQYKCVQCGMGKREKFELHIDHIVSRDKGGKATLDNGQVLCSHHNFLKKNLNQTESGKKMFINMYKVAKGENNERIINFCIEILETFDKHDINGHIEWEK